MELEQTLLHFFEKAGTYVWGTPMLVLLASLLLDSVVAALNSVRGTRLRNASS